MKIYVTLLICLIANLTIAQEKKSEKMSSNSQVTKINSKVTKVVIEGETYYITTEIGNYQILGEYLCEGKGDPIVQLNEHGTGLIQMHGMNRTQMVWGIECEADGTPKKQVAPWGGIYILWYQIKELHTASWGQSGKIDSWDAIQYSIHEDDKTMHILGERIKHY